MDLVIFGANGFVGRAMVDEALRQGLRPRLAGRNRPEIERLAATHGLACSVAELGDDQTLDAALSGAQVVLNCAGPFIHTTPQLLKAALRNGVHYLDITGELPVFQLLLKSDATARERGVMLLPGVGFDVVPTDCLALYLQQKLPDATTLRLAFRSVGPAGLPPGTQRTAIELLALGRLRRVKGELQRWGWPPTSRLVDFGSGPSPVTPFTWGDLVMAYRTTKIPNIEVFVGLPTATRKILALADLIGPLWKSRMLRHSLSQRIRPGSSPAELAATRVDVWGEVSNAQGQHAAARLHGPEAGVVWTVRAALSAIHRLHRERPPIGFQTPALAFGADFALDAAGVSREDLA